MMFQWIELRPNNCLCLVSYWSMELCVCQSFCSHAFTLFVFYWRWPGFLPRGLWMCWGWGVEVLYMVWGGSPCLLCCMPSHFMAPSVHKQTVKWWRLPQSFLLDSVYLLLKYIHICCWECVSVYMCYLKSIKCEDIAHYQLELGSY